MHRRLAATFLTLITVVGGLLAGASSASAAGLSFICGTDPSGIGEISCTVVIPSDRNLTSIQWYINGNPWENSGSATSTRFSCTPGQSYTIKYVAYLSPPPPPGGERFEGSMSMLCLGKPVRIAHRRDDRFGRLAAGRAQRGDQIPAIPTVKPRRGNRHPVVEDHRPPMPATLKRRDGRHRSHIDSQPAP